MKNKITIDKWIASSHEHATPPPPDADLMWADLEQRLDATTLPDSAPDPDIAAGPGPAGKRRTTAMTWLFLGLLGISALYALASRQMADSAEKTSIKMPVEDASKAQQPHITEATPNTLYPAGEEANSAGTASATTAAVQPVAAGNSVKPSATSGAGRSRYITSRPTSGRVSSENGTTIVSNTSATRTEATPPLTGGTIVPSASLDAAGLNTTSAGSTLVQEASIPVALTKEGAVSFAASEADEMTAPLPQALREVALLTMPSALLEIPASMVTWPEVETSSRLQSRPMQGLIWYAGSSLGKTPRVYQNYTPAGSYLNLGMGYRMALNRRWSFQPEVWSLQLETPRLTVVTEQRLDLDGERLLRYDTVSVMRMKGIGINLMMGIELPAGFTLLGGPHLGRYARVMAEQSSGTRSLVNGNYSWSSSFSYRYSPAPDWFRVYQAGLKLGVEKHFRKKVIVGISTYQGLSDLSRLQRQGPGNYSTAWVVYAGYKW